MPIVKRLVRPEPFEITTEDGYRYVWLKGGEALDVLDHHRRSLLVMKGAQLVDVDVVDMPVVLPAFRVGVPLHLGTVEPEARQEDDDLSDVVVELVDVLPEPLAIETVPAPERDQDDDLSDATVEPVEPVEPEPIEPATVQADPRPADPDLSHLPPVPTTKVPAKPLPVATVEAPPVEDSPAAEPVVGDLWSDADLDLFDRAGGR